MSGAPLPWRPWIAAPRIVAAFGLLWSFAWWSKLGGGVLVLAL